jgi:L-lactate utilization protein LutC
MKAQNMTDMKSTNVIEMKASNTMTEYETALQNAQRKRVLSQVEARQELSKIKTEQMTKEDYDILYLIFFPKTYLTTMI